MVPENYVIPDATNWEQGGINEEKDGEELDKLDVVQSAVTKAQEGITGKYTACER